MTVVMVPSHRIQEFHLISHPVIMNKPLNTNARTGIVNVHITLVSKCGFVVIGDDGQRTASSISLGVTLVFICWLTDVEVSSTQHLFPFRTNERPFVTCTLSLKIRAFSHFLRQYILHRQIVINPMLMLAPRITPKHRIHCRVRI